VATASSEIDDIRRKMALIRRELHEDVKGVVAEAEEVADWRHYIRMYPWASVAAALAIGFFVVPKRRKTVKPEQVAQAVMAELPRAPQVVEAEPARKKGRGLIGAGLALIAPVVMRAAQNYATHFVTNWIAQMQESQMAQMMADSGASPQARPPGGSPPGFGRTGGPTQNMSGGR
jgi:hypothetical protein